jgi:hypothetical protein
MDGDAGGTSPGATGKGLTAEIGKRVGAALSALAGSTPAKDIDTEVQAQSLPELFEKDTKRFEWLAKQYYDLFSYHAAQRLTAFNFFLVSLSFFSNAYALLITRNDGPIRYYTVAAALAAASYLLVISFGRLDKRNEQIIRINEQPLKRIQNVIRSALSPQDTDDKDVWETFRKAEQVPPYRSFGQILPWIYTVAAAACAAGAVYGWTGPGDKLHWGYVVVWAVMALAGYLAIEKPLGESKARPIAKQSGEKT